MDPLTQATLGAAAAAVVSRPNSVRRALLIGAAAGAAPDLDVFIISGEDPLLNLQYHRHFTHALIFAPVIGLLVAALFKGLFYMRNWPFRELLLFATLAALSHGLLDACTSYGTMLYLPFSGHRESWDLISIIDPIFTLPLVALCIAGFIRRKPRLVQTGMCFCLMYLSFGYIQRERARDYAHELAERRGIPIETVTARPSFANTILWRIIVRSDDFYTVDAVGLIPFQQTTLYEGARVPIPQLETFAPGNSQQAYDILRFNHFSQGYLYEVPDRPQVLGDLRYALFPNSIEPLWGIQLNLEAPDSHVEMVHFREPSKAAFTKLWAMICGKEM